LHILLSYQTNLYISIGASIEESTNEKCSCLDQTNKNSYLRTTIGQNALT
jgi:hypothetical protein